MGAMRDERQANGPRRVRFGLFDFDPESGELRREGIPVRLQPQPAGVLAYLLARPGEIVTREALREAIWGSETFVDFDRGLNFCVAQIRAALGDTAESPRFIRTLPKRGYQFIAPVEAASPTPAPDRAAPPASPAFRRRAIAALVIVVLTALGFAAVRWWSGRVTAAKPTTIAVVRFDSETSDPSFDRFADALTDTVVAQLTSAGQGRYQVIGNAAILRGPRERRDLKAIASALGVDYVMIGQVQIRGPRLRVLAHLIRMPEQTHVSVTRLDRATDDPLAVQLEIAQIIASDVTRRLASIPPAPSKAAD